MAETTEISWAHSTFNPWIGCTKVSPGCDNCYAKTLMDDRYGRVTWGAGEARQRTQTWDQPLAWNRKALASGKPWRVFCASLADVYDNEVPAEWRADLFNLIHGTPALTWMLLTKRIGNIRRMRWPPPSVWLGITVVNQEEANRDIPVLLNETPQVAKRWLSCEPLLGPMDLTPFFKRSAAADPAVDWVIVGGESGNGARPMNPQWVRMIREQCLNAGVPFHFKQWGKWVSVSEVAGHGEHYTFPDGRTVRRIGTKAAGHLLDGREHQEFPR